MKKPAKKPATRVPAKVFRVGDKQPPPDGTPRVVEATGVAVRNRDAGLGRAVEAAMQQAILDAAKDGVGSDKPAEVRKRMMAAREKVVREWRGESAPASGPVAAPSKAKSTRR